ncbi:hypothetical protein [Pseudomonas sp. GD03746]|uniref:hypothetical protein n=1 Tax=Pseudomonas sp. GD03746 TaxID=2975378 RepID=UPI0024490FAD|nr:hypothetical protein [Pseudomonas sp. GD03746]MDH1573638.1 hypothetical protein [Pseudomonas sp. GD03746]
MNRKVKLRNMLSPSTAEGQWVISLSDSGFSIEEIVKLVDEKIGGYGTHGSDTRLVIEYQLGHRPVGDIEHLLLPHQPSGIEFVQVTNEGFLCRTVGTASATFDVLIHTQSLSEEALQSLLEKNSEELAWMAYRNAHEGHPFGYSLAGDPPLSSHTALAGISYADLQRLFAQ